MLEYIRIVMEETLNAMLLRSLPDVPKIPRPSNRTAAKVVKNSVRGKKTKITGEQGFRNYLKYTDPLLQESDETTDKSKLADDMEKILSMMTPKTAEVYIRNEPVDNADALSEISAQPIGKILEKKRKEEASAAKIENFLMKSVKAKREKKQQQEESAAVHQAAVRATKARKEVKKEKEMQTEPNGYLKYMGEGTGGSISATKTKSKSTSQGTNPPVYNDSKRIDGRSRKGGAEKFVSSIPWEDRQNTPIATPTKPPPKRQTQKSTPKGKKSKK